MKRNYSKLIAMLFMGTVVTLTSCSRDPDIVDPEEVVDENTLEVEFEDAALASFIKEALGLDANAKITRADLAKLTELKIRDVLTEVTSLKGLEYATELTLLDFGGNPVSDLSPIKDLKKVNYLRMNNTPVTDLSALAEYTTLTYFNANQATPGISTLAPLSKNTGLQQLILRNQPLGNDGIAALENFTQLYRLNIRNTGVTDLIVIQGLLAKGAFLKTTPGASELGSDPVLDLQQLEITNCEVLEPYRAELAGEVEGACSVSVPIVDDNTEVAFANNQNLGAAIRVLLSKGEGEAITVGDLKGLERLDLREIEGELTSLAGLEHTENLTYVNANGNTIGADRSKLTDLTPLANNKNLQEIILRGQPLTDEGVKVLANFTKLYRLNLRQTQVGNATVGIIGELMSKGAFLKTTEGAEAAGNDAEIDLRGTKADDFSAIQSYIDAGTAVKVNKD